MRSRTSLLLQTGAIAMGFALLAMLYLRMTPARFLGAIAPDPGDPFLVLSILRWVADQLRGAAGDLWSPTFFYPIQGALALSDHLIGPAAAVAVLDSFGLPPAATYNTLILAAFGLSGASAFWVLRRSGLSVFAAAFAAFAWCFGAFRWGALSHLQALLSLWIPVALWSFDRLLAAPSFRGGAIFLVFYGFNLIGGSYLAYMTPFALVAIAITRFRYSRSAWKTLRPRLVLFATALLVVAGTIAVFVPYLQLGRKLGLQPSFREIGGQLVTLQDYFSIHPRVFYSNLWPHRLWKESSLWPGFLPLALLVYGWWRDWKPRARSGTATPKLAGWFGMAIAILFTELAVGVHDLETFRASRELRTAMGACLTLFVLSWILRSRAVGPKPRASLSANEIWWKGLGAVGISTAIVSYAPVFILLRQALPGFDSIRVPGRFFVFLGFALAAFSGKGLDDFLRRLKIRAPGAFVPVTVTLALLLVAGGVPGARYLKWIPTPALTDAPPVYRWLAANDEVEALVELPMVETWREAERMYFWSLHRRPIVNGYSGYLPKSFLELRRELLDFPDREAVARLEFQGVSHVVIHLDQISRRDLRAWNRWQRALDADPAPWLQWVTEQGSAVVYRILPSAHANASRAVATPESSIDSPRDRVYFAPSASRRKPA